MSGPSSLGDLLEFYVVGNFHPLRIDADRYDATVKTSGPPLCYFDEEGDRITVGSAHELRDRIIELKSANKSVVFALTAKAGPVWYDAACVDTLIMASPPDINQAGTPVSVATVPESVATPAVTAITRTYSAMSSMSSEYTVVDYSDVPTPEGPISELASTADDEESTERAAPMSTRGKQFSDHLIAAFENMMSDTESMSQPLYSMASNYDPDNYGDHLVSDIVSTTSHTEPGESLLESEQSTSSLPTLRANPVPPQDLISPHGSSSSIPEATDVNGSWADTLSESVRRAIRQLQEVANGSGNSSGSSSQRLCELDPELADSVAELVRKLVQKVTANITAAERAFPNTSAFTRDTMDRTLCTFQDFAEKIGHVALIGGYQAAAASREAADIGLQATREAIRAARDNTQVATNQLQQCLQEIAAQFNESITAQRQQESREASHSDLLNQINETWNMSQLGRQEAESQTDESMITPSSVSSAGNRYVNGILSQESDVNTFTVPEHGSPPELPRKIPIRHGAAHCPQYGSPSDEHGRSKLAQSFPEHHHLGHPSTSPPPPSPSYAAQGPEIPPSPPGSANRTAYPPSFRPHPHAPMPPTHMHDMPFHGIPPAPPPPPPPPAPAPSPPPPPRSGEWHNHGLRMSQPRESHGARFWRHANDNGFEEREKHMHMRDFPYPADHHNFHEFSRLHPRQCDRGVSHQSDSEVGEAGSNSLPRYHRHSHAPPARDMVFSRKSRRVGVVNYAVPSMSAFQDLGDFGDVESAGIQAGTPAASETVDTAQLYVSPSAPPADYLSAADAAWDEVASEMHGSATPSAGFAEAVKELKLEDDEMNSASARYQDEVQIEKVMSPDHATIVEPATPTDAGNPWSQFDSDERHARRAAQDRTGQLYHRQPNHGEVEDVGPAQDPLAGLSRAGSYADAPGMPPSPQAILQEGVREDQFREDQYLPDGRSYEPSISGYSAAPSYHTAPSIRIGQHRDAYQDASGLASRIQAVRSRRGDPRGSRPRHGSRSQMYFEMRQLSPDAQDRADINRLGLENEATDAERECARHLVELELISQDNMAMAIYYAQQAKGDVVDAIDLLEEDLKQLETYEARNRPVTTDAANSLAGESGD
ncbi:uncharacterized protein V1513DRAFT_429695 [Lipomyces chichibuensis]|uniref:uncharacterized protein n=1 Tax=Lipomyces chichibuensis TaxID=1546026 RepID=UPI00334300ED